MSIEKCADAVFDAVRTYLEKRLQEFPVPRDGKDADPAETADTITRQVRMAIEALPPPVAGKDAEPLDQAEIIKQVLAGVPTPKDGQSVTMADVAPIIEQQVKSAVEAIPKPENGRDADPEAIAAAVREAVEAIPKPKDGTSMTVADVMPLVSDQVSKAVAAIPVPKDGQSVPVDQVQKMIDEAVSKAMAAVRMPADGGPGRDAAHIEILPAIDAEKSYPRGTYATHSGGLWRSYETTASMKGWECIVDGDHDDDVLLADDHRTFTFRKIKSSGRIVEKSFVLPVVLDRGIFKEGTEYAPGDGCTWGGSFWIAQKKTMSKPDSGDGAFRLAVKRGRDGKDGPAGKQGDKGLDGRAGRDLTQIMPSGVKY